MELARTPNDSSTTLKLDENVESRACSRIDALANTTLRCFCFFVPKCGTPETPSHVYNAGLDIVRAGEMQLGLYPDDTDPVNLLLSLVVHWY